MLKRLRDHTLVLCFVEEHAGDALRAEIGARRRAIDEAYQQADQARRDAQDVKIEAASAAWTEYQAKIAAASDEDFLSIRPPESDVSGGRSDEPSPESIMFAARDAHVEWLESLPPNAVVVEGPRGPKASSPLPEGGSDEVARRRASGVPWLVATSGRVDYWDCEGRLYETTEELESDEVLDLIAEKAFKKQRALKRARAAVSADGLPQARREAIPDDVKVLVWQRDGGCCVKCGSNEALEFDHIIPVTMGGANTTRNLQLLCEPCNRAKGGNLV